MTLLNLGCGQRFHTEWQNFDFVSSDPTVKVYDLTKGIPMADNSCDVVYHSHVLEHFTKAHGANLIAECFRVLKPGGIVRVVVPDLETAALEYLKSLREYRHASNDVTKANHQWATIELIDQMLRTSSGGEMAAYWSQPTIVNEEKLKARMGQEYVAWRAAKLRTISITNGNIGTSASLLKKISLQWRNFWLRRWGITEQQIQLSKFATSGEKHLWMYDAVSLQQLLEKCGFEQVERTNAFTSGIPNWEIYQMLDVEAGIIRKPDSIFFEAIKPN